MTPKFSKALLCAGLAAALVGCGGGSSTTTMATGSEGSDEMPPELTPAETAAKKIQASYDTVKGLVDALSDTSGDVQKESVTSQVNAFLSQVRTTTDLSAADRTKFTTSGNMLLTSIKTNTTPEPTPPPAQPTEPDLRNTAWYNELSPNSLDELTKKWPDSNTLSGKKTPVTGLPAGWTGMDYSYSNTTTTTATDEQGKTFSKNVVKPTREIKLRWDDVALEAAKTNRISLINDFLGGTEITIQTIKGDTNANPLDGSGSVSTTISSHVVVDGSENNPTPAGIGEALFTDNSDHIRATDFRRKHFTAISANELAAAGIAVDSQTQPTTNVWFDLDTIKNIGTVSNGTPTGGIYVRWNNIPGLLIIEADFDTVLPLRFNDGRLEYLPVGNAGADNSVTITFRPVNPRNLLTETQNIDSMPLVVREEKTKTSVMEFAYWASQNRSSPFSVRNVDTFARQHPDMMFDDVTDNPGALTNGSIKYNGLAAGYYAIGKESHGEFTADAMLTADFGTNEVTGMINNFMPMTGDDDLSPWKLTLSVADFMDDGTFGNAFDGKTSGQSGGGGPQGSWNGQFLGKANPGTDLESAADMTNDYPEAVVGNFTGHFAANDGHVEGAFGTELHDDYKE